MLNQYARHPQLAQLCDIVSNMTTLTDADRLRLVEAAALDAGISRLDIEMCQPGADARVPFAAVSNASPADQHRDRVSSLVMQMEGRR